MTGQQKKQENFPTSMLHLAPLFFPLYAANHATALASSEVIKAHDTAQQIQRDAFETALASIDAVAQVTEVNMELVKKQLDYTGSLIEIMGNSRPATYYS